MISKLSNYWGIIKQVFSLCLIHYVKYILCSSASTNRDFTEIRRQSQRQRTKWQYEFYFNYSHVNSWNISFSKF